MDLGVEISLYPLSKDYRPVIHQLIGRLTADERLHVTTNSMSTQVFGRCESVLAALTEHLQASFAALEASAAQAAFVMKIIGPLPSAGSDRAR